MRGAEASIALLGCSRLVGLQTPDQPASMLELAATLASRVPVYRVTMGRLTEPALPRLVQALRPDHLVARK